VDIPPDLLRLRVAFLRADQKCRDLANALPTNADIATGRLKMTKELAAQLEQQGKALRIARAERMELVMAMHRHPWPEELPAADRAAARKALQDAALEELAVNA
jgi:hypothetical protein